MTHVSHKQHCHGGGRLTATSAMGAAEGLSAPTHTLAASTLSSPRTHAMAAATAVRATAATAATSRPAPGGALRRDVTARSTPWGRVRACVCADDDLLQHEFHSYTTDTHDDAGERTGHVAQMRKQSGKSN
ncbi:hypothetical protein C0Q70_01219 [Pomacea canaliculata]|uniref:Uncharacterized protein n=1 Tax=Pomacea canaliculata TaxID=400727 RepID=A0A2T7PYU8_POMCA|nr:hypothetical protein C0Q70_01219 [Pomacea canaliculata]